MIVPPERIHGGRMVLPDFGRRVRTHLGTGTEGDGSQGPAFPAGYGAARREGDVGCSGSREGPLLSGEAPAAGTTAGPSPQSTPTQTPPAKPKRILRAKAVADDADASVSAPPAGFPEHSGANDHPSGGPPPLRRKGTRPRPRRRRRPQKRRRPFQPAMPTSISWEEIRMRPRLVPRSRRSRRPASRRRGSSSSPAWFGCLSAWRRHWRS